MASKPNAPGASGVGSQKDRRYIDTFRDQHKSARFPEGRPWWGNREFAANPGDKDGFMDLHPGDHLDVAGGGWSAPFLPETRFFEYNYQRQRLTIRYDKLIQQDQEMTQTYYRAANKLAAQNGWPEVLAGVLPRQSIVDIIGEPPRSPKIGQACQAGDPWILGVTGAEANEELARLLGLTRDGFSQSVLTRTGLLAPAAVDAAPAPDLAQMIAEAVAAALAARDTADVARRAKEANRKAVARARTPAGVAG